MKKVIISISMLIVIFLVGCKSTELTNVWRNPSANVLYKNMAVIALIKENNVRNIIEEQVVSIFKQNGIQMMHGNYIIDETTEISTAVIEQALKDKGIDGVLILKPISVDKNIEVDAPPVTVGFYGPYPMWGGYFYGGYPATVSTSTTFKIENDLYDVATNKLVWSGQTNTIDPANAQTMGEGIANAIVSSLKQNHLVEVPATKK